MGTTSPGLDKKDTGGLPRVGPLGLRTQAREPIIKTV
jgi:hypothetical protein